METKELPLGHDVGAEGIFVGVPEVEGGDARTDDADVDGGGNNAVVDNLHHVVVLSLSPGIAHREEGVGLDFGVGKKE